jgi:3-oxoacyl-[acyl-carrier protein] reductase
MNLSLTPYRALVCGSTSGIGKACAMELAGLGASLTLVARNEEKLRTVVAELPVITWGAGQKHDHLVADLADPRGAGEAVRSRVASGETWHILVANTGGPPSGAMVDATLEQFQMAVNSLLFTPHELARALVPGMKAAKYGRVVTIGSTSVKQPIPNLGLSNAVRAGAANWAKTLSQELGGFGITVNNVLPGYTDTERLADLFTARSKKSGLSETQVREETVKTIPAGRLGKPEEIAAAVAFLCTPAAAYVNGVNLPVDGGRLGTL